MEIPQPFHHFEEAIRYDTFEPFMLHNTPCTFGSWISDNWPARKLWVSPDGTPDLEYLLETFGHCKASVTNFIVDSLESECKEQTISEFISYWKKLCRSDNSTRDFPAKDFHELPHYMKDWHFAKNSPSQSVYDVPELFSDDWLNRYWKSRKDVDDDYIFSYFGPAGSYTPFHADVFRSYSWSINVCGYKKWLIVYPGEELKLGPTYPLNVEQQCVERNVKHKILVQGPGQGIFVPSGWWHQVLNIADTISINHNWANFHCVPKMWHYLTSELCLVEREISDCRHLMDDVEWFDQCQLVLRANVGLNFSEFFKFIVVNLHFLSIHHCENLLNELALKDKFSDNLSKDKCLVNVLKSSNRLYNVNNVIEFVRKHWMTFVKAFKS